MYLHFTVRVRYSGREGTVAPCALYVTETKTLLPPLVVSAFKGSLRCRLQSSYCMHFVPVLLHHLQMRIRDNLLSLVLIWQYRMAQRHNFHISYSSRSQQLMISAYLSCCEWHTNQHANLISPSSCCLSRKCIAHCCLMCSVYLHEIDASWQLCETISLVASTLHTQRTILFRRRNILWSVLRVISVRVKSEEKFEHP